MKQTVNVFENKGSEVLVGCDKSACEGCKSSMFCSKSDNIFEALNPDNVDLKKGDKAVIEMPGGKTVVSILLSLGLPLAMFFPGYFIGRNFSSNEIIMFLFGVLFMGLGFCIAGIYFKCKKKKYTPIVIRKEE